MKSRRLIHISVLLFDLYSPISWRPPELIIDDAFRPGYLKVTMQRRSILDLTMTVGRTGLHLVLIHRLVSQPLQTMCEQFCFYAQKHNPAYHWRVYCFISACCLDGLFTAERNIIAPVRSIFPFWFFGSHFWNSWRQVFGFGLRLHQNKQYLTALPPRDLPSLNLTALRTTHIQQELWTYKKDKAFSMTPTETINTLYYDDMDILHIDNWRFFTPKKRDRDDTPQRQKQYHTYMPL